MEFRVYAASIWDDDDGSKLLKAYPKLSEFGYDGRCVYLASFHDLMRFYKEVASVVIAGKVGDREPYLKIYDDYVE